MESLENRRTGPAPCSGFSTVRPRRQAAAQIAVPVVDQVGLVILIFGPEPEGIGLGHGAGLADDLPEGAF